MSPSLALGALLWSAGMIGVASMLRIVPALASRQSKPTKLSPAALVAVAFAQSALLLALTVWTGIMVSPRTQLGAPLISGLLEGRRIAIAPIVISGLAGAIIGGAILLAAAEYVRRRLPEPAMKLDPPLSARLLYGGITEELLLRWGVMSVLAWLGARMAGSAQTSRLAMEIAIVASALLFGAGHLPTARAVFGGLTPRVVGYVLVANSAFGVMAGLLFWRYGIESAMLAHAGAHAIGAALGKSGNTWGAR
ncbi:MAG TPA: CPBP family glutamic-type intramembrane protease [Burkholderiales bacterium]|nr:CPBP family glutamic-type intramembrane protease [Burkholderiales bacterium]